MQRKISGFFRKAWMAITEFGQKNRFINKLIVTVKSSGHFLSNYTRVHQSIIGLTIFIILSNTLIARAAYEVPNVPTDEILSDPYVIADTVRLLSPYTPNIEEDPDALALTLEEQINGSFITTNPLIASQPGIIDETPQPQSTSTGSRGKDLKYTVQIGDTLSGIGDKFGLKIATLRVKNDLKDVDSIRPGQELTIPVQDLSDKAIKAAQDRQLASQSPSRGSKIISSAKASGGYGLSKPIRDKGVSRRLVGGHTGVDYMADVGTAVFAASDGVVAVAQGGWNGGFGNNVLVSHGSGMTTRYAHLSRYVVSPGDPVVRGQLLGYSGNTGRSTGPHLHFELRVNGVARDPGT